MKIKQGDTVKMLCGKDRGRTGVVVRVLESKRRVVVEGLNLVKKHMKQQGEKEGGIVSVPSEVDISNVQLVCPKCSKPVRVKLERTGGKKVRVCKKCKANVDEGAKKEVKTSKNNKDKKKTKRGKKKGKPKK